MRLLYSLVLTTLIGCSSYKKLSKEARGILFDGRDTAQFRGYKLSSLPQTAWEVEEGALKTIPGVANIDLLTKKEYQNFELDFGPAS